VLDAARRDDKKLTNWGFAFRKDSTNLANELIGCHSDLDGSLTRLKFFDYRTSQKKGKTTGKTTNPQIPAYPGSHTVRDNA
jgi:hypothetical protein